MGRSRRRTRGKAEPIRGSAAKFAGTGVTRPRFAFSTVVVANLVILSVLAYAGVLESSNADLYYRAVQEDEYVEWASFWAFLVATGIFLVAALRQRQAIGGIPWFLVGVGLFCFVFAMEEISWFQRQLGYRPPDYFLEHNFQQELNFHNAIKSSFLTRTLTAVMIGYGLLLPLVALVRAIRLWLQRVRVAAPPWQLAPMFVVSAVLLEIYPWTFSGEWVELMMGLTFLLVGLVHWSEFRPADAEPWVWRQPLLLAVAALFVMGLGIASAALSRSQISARPEVLAAAKRELAALRNDFTSGSVFSRCNTHKRLYSFKEKYGQDYLLEGEFAGLSGRGLPDSRAQFLLDPWNYPYWLRDRCEDGKRVTFLYSFGPNRRRESDRTQIRGDDVGVYIRR
jgi:hypothetical protein